jgi:hypothetical protein
MSTNWNAILSAGKPLVTVSSGNITGTGGTGADFGADSTSNSTPGVVGTGTPTTTSGIQEAINYLETSGTTVGGGTVFLLFTPGAPFSFSGALAINGSSTSGIIALIGQAGVVINWYGTGTFLVVDHSYLDNHFDDTLTMGVPCLADFTVYLNESGANGIELIQVQNLFLMTRVRVISTTVSGQTAVQVTGYGILCTLDRCDVLNPTYGSPGVPTSYGLRTSAAASPLTVDRVQQFTVRNCRFEGWTYGLYHDGAPRGTYQGNLIQNNQIGAYVNSYVPTFRDNWFEANSTVNVASAAGLSGWMTFEDNHFDNNLIFSGMKSLSTGAIFKRNDGVNPYGEYPTPFSPSTITPGGTSALPVSGTLYQVNYLDVIINFSGGTSPSISIYDPSANLLASGLTSLVNLYLPVGFQIKFVFGGTPTLTVAGI